jgi:hypothetical protein
MDAVLIGRAWSHCEMCKRLQGTGGMGTCRSDGATKVGYELSWLQLVDITRRQASQSVLKDFGDHVKGALHLSHIVDRRRMAENCAMRTGLAGKVTLQLSGLTPDASFLQFVQGRLDSQYAKALGETSTLTIDASTGVCFRLHNASFSLSCHIVNNVIQICQFSHSICRGPVCSLARWAQRSKVPCSKGKLVDLENVGGEMLRCNCICQAVPSTCSLLKR